MTRCIQVRKIVDVWEAVVYEFFKAAASDHNNYLIACAQKNENNIARAQTFLCSTIFSGLACIADIGEKTSSEWYIKYCVPDLPVLTRKMFGRGRPAVRRGKVDL